MRYYHLVLGVFTSRDPLKNGVDRYSFCGNGPLSKLDPMGLEEMCSEKKKEEETTAEKIAEKVKETLEKIKELKEWVEAIKNNKAITSVDALVNRVNSLPSAVIDGAIKALQEFKPDTPCGKWYAAAIRAILQSGDRHTPPQKGDCRGRCGDIWNAGSRGRERATGELGSERLLLGYGQD